MSVTVWLLPQSNGLRRTTSDLSGRPLALAIEAFLAWAPWGRASPSVMIAAETTNGWALNAFKPGETDLSRVQNTRERIYLLNFHQ